MARLVELEQDLVHGRAVVAGVLSGTSADGIDVALVRFEGSGDELAHEVLAFETRPFEEGLGRRVRSILDGEFLGLAQVAELSRDLGIALGAAARSTADRHGLGLDLVGSHGQTVYHHDGRAPGGRSTLQLGDGDHVAEASGAWVVSDFRQRDLAAGGEGAPLLALVDPLLFPGERNLAVLNLGGIANLTFLGESGAQGPLSFDVGPAGSLLDGLARRRLGQPYDRDGAKASGGRADLSLVEAALDHPFFDLGPPKSTGRDTFGAAWVEAFALRAEHLSSEDLLATAVEIVARSVSQACERFLPGSPREVVVCGGGVHNRCLWAALERVLGVPVRSSATHGLDPDAREAIAFAVLAAWNVLGVASTAPRATGARAGRVLGKLSPWGPSGGFPGDLR